MAYRLITEEAETGEEIVEYVTSAQKAAFALGCTINDLPTLARNGKIFKTFLGLTYVDLIDTTKQ